MAYKHILVALDLSPESQLLVEKAVALAQPADARLSLIHVEANYSDLYPGLIDAQLGYTQQHISQVNHQALKNFAAAARYPVNEMLHGRGDLAQVLEEAVKNYEVDLVVCGHHQDFWGKLVSSARQLINRVHIDILIVPLRDNDQKA